MIAACAAAPAPGEGTVTILRDTWGIAHVFSDSDAGAMFGAGFATAQDRMYQMHRSRRAVQGRLAELIGMRTGGPFGNSVAQDVDFRHRQLDRYARRIVTRLDPYTRLMLQAYCDGVNYYIENHADELLYLFGGEVPEPWEPADCLGAWNRLGDYFAGSGLNKSRLQHEFEELVRQYGLERAIEMFAPPRIIDEDAAVVKLSDVPQETRDAIEQYARDHGFGGPAPGIDGRRVLNRAAVPKFSHAWVVGGSKTTTGRTVLHSDPQTAIAAPPIWYEIHVRGASFDARGIGVAGTPGFLIGWNGGVAWGLTALGADMADLFELRMVGQDQYEYDGRTYDMDVWDEDILVRRTDGGYDRVPIHLRDTHLGPVVTAIAQDALPGEEFVWKALPNADADRHTLQAALAMLAARDVASFFGAIDLWRHPGVHCVFGDAAGNIGYAPLAAIPVRSIDSPVGGLIAQDGSSSQFDWQDTLPLAVRPHVFNPAEGSIWSGNHLPVGAWYPIPLYIGTGGAGDSTRSWRLAERLRGAVRVTPDDVLAVHHDDVNPARREIVRAGYHLRDVQGASLSRDALSALAILESWYARGAHSDTAEPYYAAAYHMDLQFRLNTAPGLIDIYGSGENGLCYFLKTLKQRLDDDPNARLSADEIAFVDRVLATGWQTATRNYGRVPDEWAQRFAAGPGTYVVGFFDTLEGYGSMDRAQDRAWPGLTTVDGGTILSQRGQSYSQFVDLADVDASRGILPTGLSEHPGSAHFADQGDEWIGRQLRAAPLDRTIIEGMAETRTKLDYRSPGDMNCDGAVTALDVDGFVLALFDPGAYADRYPDCDAGLADMNRDGQVNVLDVAGFIALLFR